MSNKTPNSRLSRVGWLFVLGGLAFSGAAVASILLRKGPTEQVSQLNFHESSLLLSVGTAFAISVISAVAYFGLSYMKTVVFPLWAGYLHAATYVIGISMWVLAKYFLIPDDLKGNYANFDLHAFALWSRVSSFGAFLAFASLCVFGLVLVWQIIRAWLRPKTETDGVDPHFG